jgi:hypothetical protein
MTNKERLRQHIQEIMEDPERRHNLISNMGALQYQLNQELEEEYEEGGDLLEGMEIEPEGLKYDQGKLRYDLIPPDALEEIAKVYTLGAEKYGDRNWEKGLRWGRIFGAVFRHFIAWAKGEDADEETGLHPLAHAAWGCLTLLAYAKRNIGEDDRPTTKAKEASRG